MIVHELTAAARDAAVAAYTSVHGTPPDFGFAPDRAWIEGFAHAAASVAEPVEGAEPAGYLYRAKPGSHQIRPFINIPENRLAADYCEDMCYTETPVYPPAPASAQAGAVPEGLIDAWKLSAADLENCGSEDGSAFYNKGMAAGIRQCIVDLAAPKAGAGDL